MHEQAFLLGYMEKSAALDELKQLKVESDRGNYADKTKIFRELYRQDPDGFVVDSEKDGIVGLTHKQTGFRFHMKREAVPPALTAR